MDNKVQFSNFKEPPVHPCINSEQGRSHHFKSEGDRNVITVIYIYIYSVCVCMYVKCYNITFL